MRFLHMKRIISKYLNVTRENLKLCKKGKAKMQIILIITKEYKAFPSYLMHVSFPSTRKLMAGLRNAYVHNLLYTCMFMNTHVHCMQKCSQGNCCATKRFYSCFCIAFHLTVTDTCWNSRWRTIPPVINSQNADVVQLLIQHNKQNNVAPRPFLEIFPVHLFS